MEKPRGRMLDAAWSRTPGHTDIVVRDCAYNPTPWRKPVRPVHASG